MDLKPFMRQTLYAASHCFLFRYTFLSLKFFKYIFFCFSNLFTNSDGTYIREDVIYIETYNLNKTFLNKHNINAWLTLRQISRFKVIRLLLVWRSQTKTAGSWSYNNCLSLSLNQVVCVSLAVEELEQKRHFKITRIFTNLFQFKLF